MPVSPSPYASSDSNTAVYANTKGTGAFVTNQFLGIAAPGGSISWYSGYSKSFTGLKPNTKYAVYQKGAWTNTLGGTPVTYTQSAPTYIYTLGPPLSASIARISATATTIDTQLNYVKPPSGRMGGSKFEMQYWNKATPGSVVTVAVGTSPRTTYKLNPGSIYVFRARAGNEWGFSPWGATTEILTLSAKPSPPSSLRLTRLTATTFDLELTAGTSADEVASPVNQYRVQWWYEDDTTVRTSGIFTEKPMRVSGIAPNKKVYIRAQNGNRWDWSDYSAPISIDMPTGCFVRVAGVWKKAVPYVKVAGVWREAMAYRNDYGIWKEGM